MINERCNFKTPPPVCINDYFVDANFVHPGADQTNEAMSSNYATTVVLREDSTFAASQV